LLVQLFIAVPFNEFVVIFQPVLYWFFTRQFPGKF
jgi:hypothetical protein